MSQQAAREPTGSGEKEDRRGAQGGLRHGRSRHCTTACQEFCGRGGIARGAEQGRRREGPPVIDRARRAAYRGSCSKAMAQLAIGSSARRLCAISCIADIAAMQEML